MLQNIAGWDLGKQNILLWTNTVGHIWEILDRKALVEIGWVTQFTKSQQEKGQEQFDGCPDDFQIIPRARWKLIQYNHHLSLTINPAGD